MEKTKLYFMIYLIITLITATVTVAQVFLINNKIFAPNNGYFSEEQLRDMGFNIVKNGKIYLIYNRKLIVGSDGDFLIDFEQYIPNAYLLTNGNLLVKQETIAIFLKLSKIGEIFFDKPISIFSVKYDEDELIISTTSELSEELFDVNYSNGTLIVKITPADMPKNISNGINVSKSNSTVLLSLSKQLEDYDVLIDDQNIIIKFTPLTKKIEYSKKVENFAGRSFIVNYLIADPKYVNIVPLIPKKGIGSTSMLNNILSENGFQHGVNANYFDPATGLPIDIVIANGRVLSHRYGLRPMFIQTTDNKVFIGKNYVDITIRIGEILLLVKGVNTKALGEVNLYTHEFALSIPKDISKTYFVVKNNKIYSEGYVQYVPSNSMVIMMSNEIRKKFFRTNVIGLTVSIELYTDNGFKIKNAVGAGPLLLQDGKIISDANEEKLRYGGGIPTTRTDRTIIAVKEGKVHLITIEGFNAAGMNFDEAAQFLLFKGYESAMMLDGGGSTSMVYSNRYVTNGSPRNIPVALGLK
ncbi:MAG: phosphodiester glycosidase family protein [Fervidobacterium sp.]